MTTARMTSYADLHREAHEILDILETRFPEDLWAQDHIVKEMAHILYMADRINVEDDWHKDSTYRFRQWTRGVSNEG